MVFSLELNKSLLFIFIFTLVSAVLAYKIVAKAYSGVFDARNYETTIFGTK